MPSPPDLPPNRTDPAEQAAGLTGRDYGRLLDALRGVRWPSRAVSRAAQAGAHPSRRRGTAVELTEYRAYRQGDDPRRLDWKLLARTDRAYLRITDERATLPTLLALDASASMAFPDGSRAKWRQACALAVGLASIAHAAGDPVGLVVAGAPFRPLPFRARRDVVRDVIRALDAVGPGGSGGLGRLVRGYRGAGRLVVVSDLLDDDDGLLGIARLWSGRGVEVSVAHIVAREELDPPRTGLAVDPERREVARVLSDETREPYQAAFAAWRAETARRWRAAGARYLEIATDEAPDHAVRRLVAR